MSSLRDEISKTIQRLSRRAAKPGELEETLVATDPRIGRQFGTYRVLRRLGAGGMGHVYLAIDTRLGRHAALKFLSPKLKSNPEMLARLQQEARTASSLNHPNILTIYDIDEAEGEPFIASEFVEGGTLRQALENKAVDRETILDIAIQICSALKPAHEAGVIHRDLKPANVMLRPDGLVKVIDFGLAKFTPHGYISPLYELLSDPGSVAGTVQYMSPEQARGDEIDQRTDLWSLGVMIYEMVAHLKPFDGETESHVIVAILDRNPEPLKTGHGVPSGLAGVVEKALAKNPDRRHQTAGDMLGALKALEVSSQSRPSRVFAAALANRRKARRSSMTAVACGMAAAAVLAVWWWVFHGREAVLGPAWFNPAAYTQVTNRGDVVMVTLAPDGQRLVFTTRSDGKDQLHFLNLATNSSWDWEPYAGETKGVTFSPDSSTIYYSVHDQREWGSLFSAKVYSTQPTFVLDDVDGPICFSPDGSQFVFRRRSDDKRTNRESIVVVKTADTGEQKTILSKYDTKVGPRVSWSAGNLLAVNLQMPDLSGETRATVLLLSPNGQELAHYSDPRLRLLSGPAWIDSSSMLIFSGFGREIDDSQGSVVELASRTGQFRVFPSPGLKANSMTVSADFRHIAAITYTRDSALWVANSKSLDTPERWSATDSFDSLAWDSDNSIVHPSARGGTLALWRTEPKSGSRPLSHLDDCISRDPAAVPGKKMIVFASNCEAGADASNLWMLDEADGKLTQLTEHAQSSRWPTVAPDGDTVIYNSFASNLPSLMKVSLSSRAKAPFAPLQARNAAISRDGRRVACQIRENYDGRWRFAILSIGDGAIEKDNLPLPAEEQSVVRWSPEGASLDYLNPQDPSNIWRFSFNGQPAHALTHLHGARINDFAWSANGSQLAWVSSEVRQDIIIFHRGKS